MCSLQLARCRESTVLSRGTNSVHKVQCSHLLRRALSLGDPCSLKRYTILRSDYFFPVWKQLHGDTHLQAGFKRYSQKCRTSCCLADFVAAAATRLKILMMVTQSQLFCRCAPPVGLMMFGLWGLLPLGRFVRRIIFQKNDRLWRESQTRNILTSYLRPLLLWSGVILLCRALDPLVLATEASQAIKQRFLNFVRSLSTVLAFAYCTSSLLQQLQKVMQDKQGSQDTRSVGAEFVGNTVYTAVWIGALCLFMELLGFSTQKWLTAGGLGTVLLTLAGREIFTNFLSSIMIHATRPFIVNEWIQTKIEGYEVSGTVEHVGWWSPTIVRGDDREAVHIPNHKFTVSVVRNLSQKSHWRIKTHFGISHLDASKITSIVADMRKVISKHPQVEQRRLHRRVFLESIDPENQALMVLISCFVKTPHFEEYLRVKETILLDLLKVISHHHARLATPIRSVQRLLDESDSRNSPFRDMSRSSDFNERPYLLIEATPLAGGCDADPSPSTTPQAKVSDSSFTDTLRAGLEKSPGVATAEKPKDPSSGVESSSNSKLQLEGLDSMGLNVNDITLLGAAFEKPPASIAESECLEGVPDAEVLEEMGKKSRVETSVGRPESSNTNVTDTMPMELDKINEEMGVEIGAGQGANQLKNVLSVSESEVKGAKDIQISQLQVKVELDFTVATEGVDVRDTNVTQGAGFPSSKQGGDQTMSNSFLTSKSQTEENLVLGVALDGPKRTLPLDDEDMFSSGKNEQKELVASRNGNNPGTPGKERREGREGLESPNAGLLESRDRP